MVSGFGPLSGNPALRNGAYRDVEIHMEKIETLRNFAHRTYGDIGRVVLTAEIGAVKLNGQTLPAGSVEYLLNFALQSLQDAYAGARSAAEAKGAFDGKLDKLIAGTIGTRTASAAVSDETRIQRKIVKAALKAKLGGASAEWKTFTGLEQDVQEAKLDELFTKNAEALAPLVAAELEELQRERKRKAALAAKTGVLEL